MCRCAPALSAVEGPGGTRRVSRRAACVGATLRGRPGPLRNGGSKMAIFPNLKAEARGPKPDSPHLHIAPLWGRHPAPMSNRPLWDVRQRHVWLSTPSKAKRQKRRARNRNGLQAALDYKAAHQAAAPATSSEDKAS